MDCTFKESIHPSLDPVRDGEKYSKKISRVIHALENRQNVFLSGCGGVGKTYAIHIIAKHFLEWERW